MKIETASMLKHENRNWKYASLRKQKLHVCLIMKIEITSILNGENGNCNMVNYENRNSSYT